MLPAPHTHSLDNDKEKSLHIGIIKAVRLTHISGGTLGGPARGTGGGPWGKGG